MTHKQTGLIAEALVAQELQKNNYKIIKQNYRSIWGEIDIIAQQKQTLVFVEVKMRTRHYFDATELITPSKQAKIIATAKQFLASHDNYQHYDCRFDVAILEGSLNKPTILYIPNAFTQPE